MRNEGGCFIKRLFGHLPLFQVNKTIPTIRRLLSLSACIFRGGDPLIDSTNHLVYNEYFVQVSF